MITAGPLESFFKSPCLQPSHEGDSILFHLRLDLVKLFGSEGEQARSDSSHWMLGLMGVLSGIDYLSQVYSAEKDSRPRFVETLRQLQGLSEKDSQAIYQLRCALVHSVALSTVSKCSFRKGTRFIFNITDDNAHPLISLMSDDGKNATYLISFWKLRRVFLEVIDALELIARDSTHKKNSQIIKMIGQMHSEKILKKE